MGTAALTVCPLLMLLSMSHKHGEIETSPRIRTKQQYTELPCDTYTMVLQNKRQQSSTFCPRTAVLVFYTTGLPASLRATALSCCSHFTLSFGDALKGLHVEEEETRSHRASRRHWRIIVIHFAEEAALLDSLSVSIDSEVSLPNTA